MNTEFKIIPDDKGEFLRIYIHAIIVLAGIVGYLSVVSQKVLLLPLYLLVIFFPASIVCAPLGILQMVYGAFCYFILGKRDKNYLAYCVSGVVIIVSIIIFGIIGYKGFYISL